MANNWNIPDQLEKVIRRRDKNCVYCHVKFKDNSRDKASWEHIDNDEDNINEGNIVLCCKSCNSSKGVKKLLVWLESPYCKSENINKKTVAPVVRKYIETNKNE